MLLVTCDVVSKEDADMYITRTEESYLHFDKAAEEFVHESPTFLLEETESSSTNAYSMQLDNQVSSSCSSQMVGSCSNQASMSGMNQIPLHSINQTPVNSINQPTTNQLPLVTTGSSRARSRSYSIDLVTRNSSSLNPDRSDQITVSSLALSHAGRPHSPRERLHPAPAPLSLGGGASAEAVSRAGGEAQGAAAEGALCGDAVQGAEAVADDGEAVRSLSARSLLHRLLHVRHPQNAGRPQRPVLGVDGELRHADPRLLSEASRRRGRWL